VKRPDDHGKTSWRLCARCGERYDPRGDYTRHFCSEACLRAFEKGKVT
jgi:hypothetical protein